MNGIWCGRMWASLNLRCYTGMEARDGPVGWGTALKAGRSRFRFPMVSLEFYIDIILPIQQEYFLGVKAADYLAVWEPQFHGTLRDCLDLYSDCFTFYHCTGISWTERGKALKFSLSHTHTHTNSVVSFLLLQFVVLLFQFLRLTLNSQECILGPV